MILLKTTFCHDFHLMPIKRRDEAMCTPIGPASITPANRLERFLFQKRNDRWLLNKLLLYSITEHLKMFYLKKTKLFFKI